jgi:hypothetical protein
MGSIDRFVLDTLSASGSRRLARTQADVQSLMDELAPPADGRRGDLSGLRVGLSLAFLAGVAESQDVLSMRPARHLVDASIRTARTLLKNRAASQPTRLWHAFTAGARAAQAAYPLMQAAEAKAGAARPETRTAESAPLKLFIRQPFTESDQAQQNLIAAVLAQIDQHNGDPQSFRYLTGRKAENADTFRASFEAETGQGFTPQAFRAHRLGLLAQAEAFINIRVGMSESSAFELCYHIFNGARTPVLFLVWKHAPIKTTLLRELDNVCDVTYLEFERAEDLQDRVGEFFGRCALDARQRRLAGELATVI